MKLPTPETDLQGQEPKKKVKKKKPTGILKDLLGLKRYDIHSSSFDFKESENGDAVMWSDVEKIINK